MKMMTTNEKRAIRNHANRNITYILDRLDVPYLDRGSGLLQSSCHCKQHGGDGNNTTAFSWRTDLGKWVCWTHHCEESRGNDIFGLVSSIKGTNFRETCDWLIEVLENKDIDLSSEAPDPESLSKGTKLHIHAPLKEDNLKFLMPDPQYLLDREFDLNVLRDYEVGLWSRVGTFMNDRVVFPIRDHEGHLVGYTGRTVHNKMYFERRSLEYSKWIHGRHYNRWPKKGEREFFTSSILYNLHRAKKYKKLITVEGPLDGMRLEEAGIHNWVATLSTSLCAAHRTLLLQHGVTDLFNANDNEDPSKYKDNQSPGEKGWLRTQRVVGDLFALHRVELPFDKDCGDLSVPELKEIFKDIAC